MAKWNDFLEALAAIAPLDLAAGWDNVGVLVGSRRDILDRVMTCLTITPVTAQEAIDRHADLIVTHHPVMFRPIKALTGNDSSSGVLLQLIRAGVAVYSPHTAYDNAPGGINDQLADAIGLSKVSPLRAVESRCKLVAFVPEEAMTAVSDALFAAGAGHIGSYRECSFRISGTGTFFGDASTSPVVGRRGTRENVREQRLEIVCPRARLNSVLAALRRSHPYEEPAYDVYPLETSAGVSTGEGRCGDLPAGKTVSQIALHLKKVLGASHIDVVGTVDSTVHRAAIVCGSGGDFAIDAVRQGAQLLITGEIRFHDALLAQAHQLTVLILGHYASERFAMDKMAERLSAQFPQLSIWASTAEQDPITRCAED